MATLDQRIETLRTKLAQAEAQKKQIEARKRAVQMKKDRADDTRRKILLGAALLAQVRAGEWPKEKMIKMMDNTLTRADDRALFGLPPLKGDTDQNAPARNAET